MCVCVCVCVRVCVCVGSRVLGLPSLQVGPIQVRGHRHRPLSPSQRALLEHLHCREQLGPKRSPPQSEKGKKGNEGDFKKKIVLGHFLNFF